MRKNRKYTAEEKEFLKEYIPGHSYKETCKAFNERFPEIKESQVRAYMKNNKIRSGRDCRFVKGHVPPNKGKKMTPEQYAAAAPTMFKSGHKPHNEMPVGSEVVAGDGYIWVKIDNKPKAGQYVNWKQKHILLWEEHNCPVPEGCVIKFLDDDRTNVTIENLQLITKAQNARLNQSGLHGPDPELTKLGIITADLITATAAAKRRNK
ncbi:MAG: HNH endonuclease signature motif containing protein [Bacillota bacterium]|nr:HNH endonuclease signature motif containing protein [Bacillota bacterium]